MKNVCAGLLQSSVVWRPASEWLRFRSQAFGWLLITARYIESLAVNNVITALQGSVLPAGTRSHLFFFPSLFHFLSFHNERSSVLLMLCNYSNPVAPGRKKKRKRAHSPKANTSTITQTSPHPPPLYYGQLLDAPLQGNHSIIFMLHRNAESAALQARKARQGINTHSKHSGGLMQMHLHSDDMLETLEERLGLWTSSTMRGPLEYL